ncbi:MAG: hypothetical protein WD049_02480 [Candidatus Paceibacterota bacterium]
MPTTKQEVPTSEPLVDPKPLPGAEIGTVASSCSSFHKKLECPNGHKFEAKTSEEGKQIACPECGTFILVPKTGLIAILAILVTLALPFLLCGGCLTLLSDSSSSSSSRSSTSSFESQFSAWDGSHYAVNERIKASMNDPGSFEHVKTIYFEVDDYYIVKTTFRGKNAFGGTVTNTANAQVSRSGTVMDMTID